jgi:glutaconyl-CoA/methylmalonyl-CoA decarboxylase subunit gamma
MARTRHLKITVEGKIYDVVVEDVTDDDSTFYPSPGLSSTVSRPAAASVPAAGNPAAAPTTGTPGADDKLAPMGGMIVELSVKEGERVEAGKQVLIMEAMKMKQVVTAHKDGTVSRIHVKPGDAVDAGQPLLTIE